MEETAPEEDVVVKHKRLPIVVHPNATKSLRVLDADWQGCIRCDLGKQRDAASGVVVTGGGRPRGIMFIGESPSVYDERSGHPFSDNSGGRLMQKCMNRYKIKESFATYLVGCRSCAPVLDNQGFQKKYPERNGRPGGFIFQNQPPTQIQMDACAPRLYEEIYIVDPIVIVAMGQAAASFLYGSTVNIKKMRGCPMEIEIPGAGHVAVMSAKKHEWHRKLKGVEVLPTKQSTVRYIMIPTYDASMAYDNRHNTTSVPNVTNTSPTTGNIYKDFTKDVFMAKAIYDRYHEEVSGILPEVYEMDVAEAILEEMAMEDAEDGQ